MKKYLLFAVLIFVMSGIFWSCEPDGPEILDEPVQEETPAADGSGTDSSGTDADGAEDSVIVYAANGNGEGYWKDGVYEMICSGEDLENYPGLFVTDIELSGGSLYASVYYQDNLGDTHSGYFKDKVFHECCNTGVSQAESIAVHDGSVYVGGFQDSDAVVWKDSTEIARGDDVADPNYAYTMAVTGSGTIYFGGYKKSTVGIKTFTSGVSWLYSTSDGRSDYRLQNDQNSMINGVALSSGDNPEIVYWGGHFENSDGKKIACFWEEKTSDSSMIGQELGDGSSNSEVYVMTVDGSDIYAGGYVGNTAGYWKNGTWVGLSDGSSAAAVRCLVISGEDVYAGGYITVEPGKKIAGYWKNGDWVKLGNESSSTDSFISSMIVNRL